MSRGRAGVTGSPGASGHDGHGGRGEGVGGGGRNRDSGGNGGGPQVRQLALNSSGGAVTRCRDFTAAALTDWGWLPAATTEDQERADDVLLMVSELVTNACLHTDGPERLVLRHTPATGLFRAEVHDPSPTHPRAKTSRSPALPGGHGLMVLGRLAGAWGSEAKPDGAPGKVVWL
ncbi:ATP-binding protein [Streptomyces sp. NPDC090025]|uniref:ATP-binding protein n=1 Tax=Streptomyces sp. NPDC090025 TaxID=3365922 RepID=UPI003839017B